MGRPWPTGGCYAKRRNRLEDMLGVLKWEIELKMIEKAETYSTGSIIRLLQ